ncbi:hypothetical protein E2C01_022894 [Portunus trituberculatus]|uniref:Uncharacterized protein n=1 Tax=Portunus trituberculatus TaxID=210409 RepID=A0A5B7E6L5_PORTR|nr:hypothetical protein [Portunus trituberculatus]
MMIMRRRRSQQPVIAVYSRHLKDACPGNVTSNVHDEAFIPNLEPRPGQPSLTTFRNKSLPTSSEKAYRPE